MSKIDVHLALHGQDLQISVQGHMPTAATESNLQSRYALQSTYSPSLETMSGPVSSLGLAEASGSHLVVRARHLSELERWACYRAQ